MNNLSWFLYLADILPKLLLFPVVITGAMLVVFIATAGITYLCGVDDTGYGYLQERGEERKRKGLAIGKSVVPYIFLWLLFVTIHNMIPSRETFYLIAGSELGEQVVKTPEAREIFEDIKAVIKQQIKPPEVSK